jgi:predicted nucleic acid-binding protein
MESGREVPLINLLQVYEFSKEDAQKAAELELELHKKGKEKMMTTDLITTAIVMNKCGYLYTTNDNFKQLKDMGLKLFLSFDFVFFNIG